MNKSEMSLVVRIERIERENRLLKAVSVGCSLAIVILVLMGAGKKPRILEAEEIVVHDSHGRARITIGTPEVSGVAIGADSTDPVIWLSDENGTDRAILGANGLRFATNKGRPLIALESDPRPGRSALQFYDSNGKISWSAP